MREKCLKKYYIFISFIFLFISSLWILKVKTQPFSDFNYYNELAKQIASGGSWGNTYTSVGYSIFLALFYKIFGYNIVVAKVVNLILSMLSLWLLKEILGFTKLNERGRLIIFLLFTFFPATIFYNSILGSEILFTFLVLLLTYVYFKPEIRFKYIYSGILVGLLTMVKPFFIVFFFAIFLLETIFYKNFISSLKNSITILLISLLVLSPWLYRNTKLNNEFTYVSNNSGIVLYINNNSQNTYGRWMAANDVENSIVKTSEYKKASMTKKNKMLSTAAKKWIKKHPKEFVILGFKRLFNTYFTFDDISYSFNGVNLSKTIKVKALAVYGIIKNIIFIPDIIYILLYSVYILICLIKRNVGSLDKFKVYLCILFYMYTVVYFVTEGQSRYAFPMIFMFCYMSYEFLYTILLKNNFKLIRRINR